MKSNIEQAYQEFKSGKLVSIPTETVYGLAAPINDREKLKKIFELKERPLFDPLIIHVDGIEMAKRYCWEWPQLAQDLAEKFWPGPLTIVLPKKGDLVSDMITSGLETVGIRCPDHQLTLDLITKMGVPLAAPSANKFTKTSPTCAEHVRSVFDLEDVFVLDGGPSQVGIESTIVKIVEDKLIILRAGMITKGQLKSVVLEENIKYGMTALGEKEREKIESPGQYYKHYCPSFPLLLGSASLLEMEELIEVRFGYPKGSGEQRSLDLNPVLAARSLYTCLRTNLAPQKKYLYLQVPSKLKTDELWRGIWDRLSKASLEFLG